MDTPSGIPTPETDRMARRDDETAALPEGALPRGVRLADVPKDTKEKWLAGRIRKLVDVDKFLAERINDFRHAQQIDTENAAIRRLIVRGLRAERETLRVTSKAARDDDLRARLKANNGEMCEDLVLQQAIADSRDYMVAGIFIPIDPTTAQDRIIDGHPLWVMRVESRGDVVEIAERDEMWKMSLALGKSVGECMQDAFEAFKKAHPPKTDLKVVPN
jgi:hypothetical protein